jgi:hypothetical protein
MTKRFTCGIDIGTKNLAISFVSADRIICYKGSTHELTRYEIGQEPEILSMKGKVDQNEAFIIILESLEEFKETSSTVIEQQVSMNKSEMTRLDGIAYGGLSLGYKDMKVNLHGSGIRKKFLTTALTSHDTTQIRIPSGVKDVKILSCQFVAVFYKDFYNLITQLEGKIDNICDSIVYAGVANRYR